MNRLILIGNGFDLAHGLKTDYNSFILWYIKKCFITALKGSMFNSNYTDEIVTVTCNDPYFSFGVLIGGEESVKQMIDQYYLDGLIHIFYDTQLFHRGYSYQNPFNGIIKSNLFGRLMASCSDANWVDIENEFYVFLKSILDVEQPRRLSLLEKLNDDLKAIIKELEEYLSTIECEKYSPWYADLFNSTINLADIVKSNLKTNDGPVETLILNFNYTPTVEKYLKKSADLPHVSADIKVNYIHGRINDADNKLIFGFGDELDEDYKNMELSKENGFFEHIKSFGYFKTSNYHNLLRFIEIDEYQIYTLGHSCGLSDRTMLNMIFEHPNCKSIKIFYHGDKEKNNYTRLTQEISRHFRDKVAMRSKIVPFDKSFPMAQV